MAKKKTMSSSDIATVNKQIIKDFGQAAYRCKKGGLDGIEVLCHNHLLGQFLSPSTNLRSDMYGGSVNNRLRLILETLTEIRDKVGDDFIVGIRMAADEQISRAAT